MGISNFDTNYTVLIRGFNGDQESETIKLTYATSSCLETFKNLEICGKFCFRIKFSLSNIKIKYFKKISQFVVLRCIRNVLKYFFIAPPTPENLTALEEIVDKIITEGEEQILLYDITVSWKQPEYTPDNYIVKLVSLLPVKENRTSLMSVLNGVSQYTNFLLCVK